MNSILDKIRGCLYGGAVGDALGYPIEFYFEFQIFKQFGEKGIQSYVLDKLSKQAIISDDTQMTLFTAYGLLVGAIKKEIQESEKLPRHYISMAYQDWLHTQDMTFEESQKFCKESVSWLLDIPQLYSLRAPGNTCLSALTMQKRAGQEVEDYIKWNQNDSKGCGGIMRVAPIAFYPYMNIEELDWEGAQAAAITHSHSLGYMPAAVVVHILHRIVFSQKEQNLTEIVMEARDTVAKLFEGDEHLEELIAIINLAIELSENEEDDLENIHKLGEGWVAEETLGIALYCSLRYQHDFAKGIIVAVNHDGDSDSTGAVTGNILGAFLGFEKMEQKWKENLELSDVILELADDLYLAWEMGKHGVNKDSDWMQKYIN